MVINITIIVPYSQFSIVLTDSKYCGLRQHPDTFEGFLAEDILRKATENTGDDQTSFFINDDEFKQVSNRFQSTGRRSLYLKDSRKYH